jgi:hypothetical protein
MGRDSACRADRGGGAVIDTRIKVTWPLVFVLLLITFLLLIRDPGSQRQQPVARAPLRPDPTRTRRPRPAPTARTTGSFEERVSQREAAYRAAGDEAIENRLHDFVEGKARVRTTTD